MQEANTRARSQLGIRTPISTVFEAFTNPEVTTKFWYTHSSGSVEPGAHLEWRWAMYDLVVPVLVIEVVENEKILIEWGENQSKSTVLWEFTEVTDNLTFVTITNYHFKGSKDEVIDQITDSTKGFTFVLAGLKAWLEHDIQLRLTEDAYPKELMAQGI